MANNKELSEAEIKKRLKARGKGDLIKIIVNLSATIDAHKEHKEQIHQKLNDINGDGGFKDYADYSNLIDLVNEDV